MNISRHKYIFEDILNISDYINSGNQSVDIYI